MTLSAPLRLRRVREKCFALNGTPTDCVIMAVREVMDAPPDLVLSGINAGQNVGDHVLYSGTVAGAMEGAFLGIRSIALSQAFDYVGRRSVPWNTVETLAPKVIETILDLDIPAGTLMNVNFPSCTPELVTGTYLVSQGKFEHGLYIDKREDGRGLDYFWLTFGGKPPEIQPETDIKALQDGAIAVSPLKLDLTDERLMARLKDRFSPQTD
jgi:5'-nucleotidase